MILPLVAFPLLAAGTWRQSELVFGRRPPRHVRLAMLGGGHALLLLSLLPVLAGPDAGRRLVAWFGELTLAALLTAAALCLLGLRRPARRARLGRAPAPWNEHDGQAHPPDRRRRDRGLQGVRADTDAAQGRP